jgi:hypothetical protein
MAISILHNGIHGRTPDHGCLLEKCCTSFHGIVNLAIIAELITLHFV